MEADTNNSNITIQLKPESIESPSSIPNPQSCSRYVNFKLINAETGVTIKQDEYQDPSATWNASNTGIARNNIKIELDLTDDDDLSNYSIEDQNDSSESNIEKSIDITKRCETKCCNDIYTKYHMAGNERYKCKICNKCFSTKIYLLTHMKNHIGERNHTCEICHKSFITEIYMLEHMKGHSARSDYKCEICDKCFTSSQSLAEHVKMHNDGRNYKCEICIKWFATKMYLSKHMKTHNDARNCKCEICCKYFNEKAKLLNYLAMPVEDDTCSDTEPTIIEEIEMEKRLFEEQTGNQVHHERPRSVCGSTRRLSPHIGYSTHGDDTRLNDEILMTSSIRELHRKLHGRPSEEVTRLMQKRRTLKNRSYAQNCRSKRAQQRRNLETTNQSLRDELHRLKVELARVSQERDDLKQRLQLQIPSQSARSAINNV